MHVLEALSLILMGAVLVAWLLYGIRLLLFPAEPPSPPREPSELERRFKDLLYDSDFTSPHPEYRVKMTDGEWPRYYRIDFAWPEQKIAVETDGREWHDGRESYDSRRDARLGQLGWRTIRLTWSDVVHRPEETLDLLYDRGVPVVPSTEYERSLGFDDYEPNDRAEDLRRW